MNTGKSNDLDFSKLPPYQKRQFVPDDADLTDDPDGWGWIDYFLEKKHVDSRGLVGLPVTGFAAYQFENGFVTNDDGDPVKAFYGGLFQHKANVRRQ